MEFSYQFTCYLSETRLHFVVKLQSVATVTPFLPFTMNQVKQGPEIRHILTHDF